MHACRERGDIWVTVAADQHRGGIIGSHFPVCAGTGCLAGCTARFTSGHPGTGYMSTPGVWTAGRTDEPVQPAVRGWSSSLVGLSLPSVDFVMSPKWR